MRSWLPALLLAVPFAEGSWPLRAESVPQYVIEEVQHTMTARKLLLDDEDLGNLNLGVVVTDRVAVLWGPVPRLELGLRAESLLRGMIELRGVRNELHVIPPPGAKIEAPKSD